MATITFTAAELQAIAASLPVSTPAPIPTPVPVPTGSSWVYHAGVFVWGQAGGGDYSFNTGSIDYANAVGKPGGTCIAVPIISPWGGWQPYAAGKKFDTSPFKYLTYALKPTQPNQVFATGFAAINDVADGSPVTIAGPGLTKYGPVPQVGVWGTYKIPLVDFGLTNVLIQKFSIADSTGVKSNLFYVDEVGFSP